MIHFILCVCYDNKKIRQQFKAKIKKIKWHKVNRALKNVYKIY